MNLVGKHIKSGFVNWLKKSWKSFNEKTLSSTIVESRILRSMLMTAILIFSTNIEAAVPTLSETNVDKIVHAIYICEGGDKTNWPFGIKSVDTKKEKDYKKRYAIAKKNCKWLVREAYRNWSNRGRKGSFWDYLGNTYCPAKSDVIGNKNLRRNLKILCKDIKI